MRNFVQVSKVTLNFIRKNIIFHIHSQITVQHVYVLCERFKISLYLTEIIFTLEVDFLPF